MMESGAGGGEQQVPAGSPFELTGGRPCLDLVNTLEARATRPRERLERYEDLVAWGEQSRLLTRREASRLRREAREHPRLAEAALERATSLREALFGIFRAAATGRVVAGKDLETLNRHLPEALSRLRLEVGGEGPAWGWDAGEKNLDLVLHQVIDDAADLLTSPDLARVRECEEGRCAWLFLDHSRNRTRKWCDMTVCGNRAKARRHYERSRTGSRHA